MNLKWPQTPDNDLRPWYAIARAVAVAPVWYLSLGLRYLAVLLNSLSHREALYAMRGY